LMPGALMPGALMPGALGIKLVIVRPGPA
jgi:hypothetical protein